MDVNSLKRHVDETAEYLADKQDSTINFETYQNNNWIIVKKASLIRKSKNYILGQLMGSNKDKKLSIMVKAPFSSLDSGIQQVNCILNSFKIGN